MLKKLLFLLLSINVVIATPSNTPQTNEQELTQRQLKALEVIRIVGPLACAADMASEFAPKDSHYLIKATIFIPMMSLFFTIGYLSWDELRVNEFFKRHKWLLMGL